MKHSYIFLAIGILFLGCSSLNTVLEEKESGKGTRVVYDVNFEDAWLLAKLSFSLAGCDAIEEYKNEGYMLTSKGSNLTSYGAVMGAWIEPTPDNKMAVTVISKRGVSTNIFKSMTEDKYHEIFKAGMEILVKGEKLPLSSPKDSN